jgi:hypothetical protein
MQTQRNHDEDDTIKWNAIEGHWSWKLIRDSRQDYERKGSNQAF